MKNWSAAAIAALLLAGCNSQEKGGNGAAAGNGANAAGNAAGPQAGASNPAAPPAAGDPNAQSIQPGEWEMTSVMTSLEAPGAPPAAAQQMRGQLNQPQVRRQCITPDQAANVARNLMGADAASRGCQFTDTVFAGGVVRIAMSCQQPGGGSMRMAVDGGFSATQMSMAMRMSMTAPPTGSGPQSINMAGRMTGRRIGECPARGTPPRVTVPVPAPAPPSPPMPRP
ncbi:MAG TPA: DUF3617 domain-containing protein [Allosphingosinicella sp.]|nr:DUF3617 domain-containing protein [Allosphingosinicella sp.]